MSSQLWHRHSAQVPNFRAGVNIEPALTSTFGTNPEYRDLGQMSSQLWHRHSDTSPDISSCDEYSSLALTSTFSTSPDTCPEYRARDEYRAGANVEPALTSTFRHKSRISSWVTNSRSLLWHRHSAQVPNIELKMSSQLWHRHSAARAEYRAGANVEPALTSTFSTIRFPNIELGRMSSKLWHRHSALVPNIELGRMSSQLWCQHRNSTLVPNIELLRMSSQLCYRHSTLVPNIELGRMSSQLWHRHSTLVLNIIAGTNVEPALTSTFYTKSRISSRDEYRASSDIDVRH